MVISKFDEVASGDDPDESSADAVDDRKLAQLHALENFQRLFSGFLGRGDERALNHVLRKVNHFLAISVQLGEQLEGLIV